MHLPTNTSVTRPRFFGRGFTLIEVMVAAVILGMTSFSLLSLLRASDQLAIRARVNGALASQVKARGGLLAAVPYETAAAHTGLWTRGGLGGVSPGGGGTIPDAFTLPGDSEPCYLLYGKALPGDSPTAYRPLGAYLETISVVPNPGGTITIFYQLRWEDPLGQPGGSTRFTDVNLTFTKYDPSTY